MTCTPCRVTMKEGPDAGKRYEISRDGSVRYWSKELGPDNLPVGSKFSALEPEFIAKAVRAEAARQRRNRNARERNQAMRDLGMVKTPYGWE